MTYPMFIIIQSADFVKYSDFSDTYNHNIVTCLYAILTPEIFQHG